MFQSKSVFSSLSRRLLRDLQGCKRHQHERSPYSVKRRVKILTALPLLPSIAAHVFVVVASNEGRMEQLGGDAARVPVRRITLFWLRCTVIRGVLI
ncbi:hypothetical protein Y032_0236g3211 [Ancylostoma ceylanicum]|uniref:Uncharacterized protein n=1 Tax=Ancylostoma ceylanicum TaxID=53326 RepID=A0A016SFD9_9BILA|nr:hypothetical protein Y032_0236g3211 [Ancylostoma ceylanicum]